MKWAGMLGIVTWSRITSITSRSSIPGRLSEMLTNVPFGPRSLVTACSVVQPVRSWSAALAMTSPRRRPFWCAGDPSNTRTTVMLRSSDWMVIPSP